MFEGKWGILLRFKGRTKCLIVLYQYDKKIGELPNGYTN